MAIRSEMNEWLDKQPVWTKVLASGLSAEGSITQACLEQAAAVVRSGQSLTASQEKNLVHSAAPGSIVRLLSLGPVRNVDALAPRKALEFGPIGMTVIYGANGSGKSGYTRLLKVVSGVAPVGSLRGNVYQPGKNSGSCPLSLIHI